MEQRVNDLMGVAEFLNEAKRRHTERQQELLREQAARIAENRARWGAVLDEIRGQLPDVLRGFVVVTDPDVMDESPSRLNHHRYVELHVPLCAPISFDFVIRNWTIAGYSPREALGIEADDDDQPYLRSRVCDEQYTRDIYIAVATAHDHYPTWRKLEEEVDWWLEGKRQCRTTATAGFQPIYGIDGSRSTCRGTTLEQDVRDSQ